jgi:hypothetical protein
MLQGRELLPKGEENMRKLLGVLAVLACASFAFWTAAASATSGAHFFSDTSASVTDNGALSIFIDEAGVGQQTDDFTVAWTATADYGCINGGGNHPKAANKSTATGGGSSSFPESPINGRVRATVTVDGTPPAPTNGFTCPSGQTLVLADVSYSVTVTDTTNGDTSPTLTASRTFFTFK